MKKPKKPLAKIKKGENRLGAGIGSQEVNDYGYKEIIKRAKKRK